MASVGSCSSNTQIKLKANPIDSAEVLPGINQLVQYKEYLSGKSIALVVNHTSLTNSGTHLVDLLTEMGTPPKLIFAPEHGFRGKEDAGAKINDEIDPITGIPIVSLYGNRKKPSKEDLMHIDLLIFDIQDVGVRFYTYISTLHYVMESAVEHDKELWVLDRPNPHAHYVDGCVLESRFKSFVGMHPVPVVYGMTIGEYANMIKGEKWIYGAESLKLKVIPIKNWSRTTMYILPIKPSPNLPNQLSVMLYPSLCFFEGTDISVGRGTNLQFQQIGHPAFKGLYSHAFNPMPNEGASNPMHNGKTCYGLDFSSYDARTVFDRSALDLSPLIEMLKATKEVGVSFFLKNDFFDKLAGTTKLREQLSGLTSEKDIRASWEEELERFRQIRQKYLMYR